MKGAKTFVEALLCLVLVVSFISAASVGGATPAIAEMTDEHLKIRSEAEALSSDATFYVPDEYTTTEAAVDGLTARHTTTTTRAALAAGETWCFTFYNHLPAVYLYVYPVEIYYVDEDYGPVMPVGMDIDFNEIPELAEFAQLWYAPIPEEPICIQVTRDGDNIDASFEFTHEPTGYDVSAELGGTIIDSAVSFNINYYLPDGLRNYSMPLNYSDCMSDMEGTVYYSLPAVLTVNYQGAIIGDTIQGAFQMVIEGQWARWRYHDKEYSCAWGTTREELLFDGIVEWTFSNLRLSGDFRIEVDLSPGDLLLGVGTKIVPGFWSHIGMYIGNGQVVESHIALGGVAITPLESWFERYKTWATLRVVSANDEVRRRAIEWATHPDRLDDPYDLMWWQKDADGEAWYCSELVWAAYLYGSNGKINIEYRPDITGITPDEIVLDEDTEIIATNYGETPRKGFVIMTKSPVDIEVADPENLEVNKQTIEIPGAIYGEDDIDGDGSPEDWIGIPERKNGDYLVSVIPESGASLTDTYTLQLLLEDGTIIVLAEDVQISDIPSAPYVASIPSEPEPSPEVGFASLTGEGKLVIAYNFDPFTTVPTAVAGWTWYDPTLPAAQNNLAKLSRNTAYWIKVTEECWLTYGTQTYHFAAGWNNPVWLGC